MASRPHFPSDTAKDTESAAADIPPVPKSQTQQPAADSGEVVEHTAVAAEPAFQLGSQGCVVAAGDKKSGAVDTADSDTRFPVADNKLETLRGGVVERILVPRIVVVRVERRHQRLQESCR